MNRAKCWYSLISKVKHLSLASSITTSVEIHWESQTHNFGELTQKLRLAWSDVHFGSISGTTVWKMNWMGKSNWQGYQLVEERRWGSEPEISLSFVCEHTLGIYSKVSLNSKIVPIFTYQINEALWRCLNKIDTTHTFVDFNHVLWAPLLPHPRLQYCSLRFNFL